MRFIFSHFDLNLLFFLLTNLDITAHITLCVFHRLKYYLVKKRILIFSLDLENVWITLYIALFLKRLLKSKNGQGHTCSPLMQDVFSYIYDLGLKMKASYKFLKRESLHKTIIFSPNMYAYLMTYSCADYIPWWLIHCLLGNAFFSCNW